MKFLSLEKYKKHFNTDLTEDTYYNMVRIQCQILSFPNVVIYTESEITNDLSKYDILFDCKDENGESILPFTRKTPLYIYMFKPYYNEIFGKLNRVIPNFNKIKTVKVGILDSSKLKNKEAFKIDYNQFIIRYNFFTTKIDLRKDFEIEIFNLCDRTEVQKEIELLKEKVHKLNEELERLYEPDGVLCRAGMICFEENKNYEGL